MLIACSMRRFLASLLLSSACIGPNNPPSTPEAAAAPFEYDGYVKPALLEASAHLEHAAVAASPEPFADVDRCVTTTTIRNDPATATRLSEINSLIVVVSLSRTCRAEAASIELFTPHGSAFEVRSAPLNGGKEVRFNFPVAGSTIEQRRLAGVWEVRTLLDGAAIANPAAFELTDRPRTNGLGVGEQPVGQRVAAADHQAHRSALVR